MDFLSNIRSGSRALSRAVRVRMLCEQLTKEFTGNVSGNEMCVTSAPFASSGVPRL